MQSSVPADSKGGYDSCSSISNDDDGNTGILINGSYLDSLKRDDGYYSEYCKKNKNELGRNADITADAECSFAKEHSRLSKVRGGSNRGKEWKSTMEGDFSRGSRLKNHSNNSRSRSSSTDSHISSGSRSKSGSSVGKKDSNNEEPSEVFLLLFIIISFGYMLPWTAMGSLISYYKENYSANFYVRLYCAYYLPGLPVALLQYRYDVTLDLLYGSQVTYFLKGIVSYFVMMGILLSFMVFHSQVSLVVLFGCLGKCNTAFAIQCNIYAGQHRTFLLLYQ